MLEIVDSPLYDHGRQPGAELGEPRVERLFRRVLREVRPDVVHVHELAGLPSSVLEIAHSEGAPVVMTLQDYFPLCPAFRLVDADGRVCTRREVGEDCLATLAADPRRRELLIEASLRHDVGDRRGIVRLARLGAALRRTERATAHAYQRRREVNAERLGGVDLLLAMSHRVAELYAQLGVDPARLRTLHLTLAHVERLRPRPPRRAEPLTFATLAALESETKGARVLLDAVRALGPGPYRVLVFGYVDPRFEAEARALPQLELRGAFRPDELDAILDEVDVGLLPSIWEEAYGYVGIELLAKGIPVVGNAIGGIVDYVRDGETGWLNRSCGAEELARIMGDLVAHPERVGQRSGAVLAARERIVKPMAAHADEMDVLYAEVATAFPPARDTSAA